MNYRQSQADHHRNITGMRSNTTSPQSLFRACSCARMLPSNPFNAKIDLLVHSGSLERPIAVNAHHRHASNGSFRRRFHRRPVSSATEPLPHPIKPVSIAIESQYKSRIGQTPSTPFFRRSELSSVVRYEDTCSLCTDILVMVYKGR